MKKLIYRLKNGRTPESWELPLRNIILPKLNKETGAMEDKFIHYLPGAPSIWADEYKGDKKPLESVIFENGILEVSATDHLLIEILSKHRFHNVHYELYDNDVQAQTKLDDYLLKDQASELVSTTDGLKTQALALAIIGQETMSWSVVRCRAELKERAFTNPKSIIDEAEKPNYEVKYLVGLAFLKGLIRNNESQTAVVWSDNGGVIVRVAVGENGIEEMTKFLSVQSESSLLTLQRLGEMTQSTETSPVEVKAEAEISAPVDMKKDEVINSQSAVISSQADEIAELRRMLAEKEAAVDAIATVSTSVLENEDESREEATADEAPRTIEELQAEYKEKHGKEVPVNKKNDAKWLLGQLQ